MDLYDEDIALIWIRRVLKFRNRQTLYYRNDTEEEITYVLYIEE